MEGLFKRRNRTTSFDDGAPYQAESSSSPPYEKSTDERRLFKRRRKENEAKRTGDVSMSSLEGSFSEEILLRCLSFLAVQDVLTMSQVSRAWYRLSKDPQIWKSLYFHTFAHPSSRYRTSLSFPPSSSSAVRRFCDTKSRPWRELYKISSNWRNGHARSSTIIGDTVRKSILSERPPTDLDMLGETSAERFPSYDHNSTDNKAGDNFPMPVSSAVLPPRRKAPLPAHRGETSRNASDTILQFHKHYIFTTPSKCAHHSSVSSGEEATPVITILKTLTSGESKSVGSISCTKIQAHNQSTLASQLAINFFVTEMRLDDKIFVSHGNSREETRVRLAVFYSTGQFSIFDVTLHHHEQLHEQPELAYEEIFTSFGHVKMTGVQNILSPVATSASTPVFDPVVLARLHSPLLVTCSKDFTLRFWSIREETGCDGSEKRSVTVEEASPALQTKESWWPVVLSLTPPVCVENKSGLAFQTHDSVGSPFESYKSTTFKVTLAYSKPIFPNSWSVGVQEIMVNMPQFWLPKSVENATSPNGSCVTVLARHAVAPPTRPTGAEGLVTAIEFTHPYIVTSRTDNTIDVFELISIPVVNSSGSISGRSHSMHPAQIPPSLSDKIPPLKICHRRTLFGHTGRVSSVAVEEGDLSGVLRGRRCISGGADGSVRIWDLDANKSAYRTAEVVEADNNRVQELPKFEKELNRSTFPPETNREVHHNTREVFKSNESARRLRIKRLWFDEEKVISVVEGIDSGEPYKESIRVLRFD